MGSSLQMTLSPSLTLLLGIVENEMVKTSENVEQKGLLRLAISCAAFVLK